MIENLDIGKYRNHEIKNGVTIGQMQNKMIELLQYIMKLCGENDLRFWCGGGSMLGAIRHKGFVPWDDDIDIFMPRPDYERLYRIWDEVGDKSRYALFRSNKDYNMHTANMHLVDINTTLIHKHFVNEDIPMGVYIDIAPFDACPNSRILRGIQIYHAILFCVFNVQRLPDNQGRLLKIPTKILLNLIKDKDKRYQIWKKHERLMSKYDYEKCKYVKEIMTSFRGLFRLYPKAYFDRREAAFENITIIIPKSSEEYLTKIFGDYSSFPPENKRLARFDDIVYLDLNQSYTKFKGKYYLRGENE